MKKQIKKTPLQLAAETVRLLSTAELVEVAGGKMKQTGVSVCDTDCMSVAVAC